MSRTAIWMNSVLLVLGYGGGSSALAQTHDPLFCYSASSIQKPHARTDGNRHSIVCGKPATASEYNPATAGAFTSTSHKPWLLLPSESSGPVDLSDLVADALVGRMFDGEQSISKGGPEISFRPIIRRHEIGVKLRIRF